MEEASTVVLPPRGDDSFYRWTSCGPQRLSKDRKDTRIQTNTLLKHTLKISGQTQRDSHGKTHLLFIHTFFF